MDTVDEEAFVAAIAAQDAVREQVMRTGCLHPFAFIWMTRDRDGVSLSSPSTKVIRADPKQLTDTDWNGPLFRDVKKQIRETDAAAVVFFALGSPPTATSHGVVAVHLETRGIGRRVWLARLGCSRRRVPLGPFRELRDHPSIPRLLPERVVALLN